MYPVYPSPKCLTPLYAVNIFYVKGSDIVPQDHKQFAADLISYHLLIQPIFLKPFPKAPTETDHIDKGFTHGDGHFDNTGCIQHMYILVFGQFHFDSTGNHCS